MNVKPCMKVLQIELNRKYPLNSNVVYLMCTLLKAKSTNQPNKKKRNSFDKNVCEIYCYLHALESDKDFN